MTCRRFPLRATFILPAACVLALTTLVGISSAADVTATRLDGSTTSGQLREWDNGGVLIVTPAGEQRIAADQLVSLRGQPATASSAADKSSGLVELIDGSSVPIKSITIEKSNATLSLVSSAASAENKLQLPTSQLAAARFRQLDGTLATQWDEIRRLNAASDIVAVLKKDGKSLDYVEGVVGDVAADKIEFKLEGETQRVDRAKIAGIIYYRPDRRTKDEPRAIIHSPAGLRLTAAHIELKNSLLTVTTPAGAKLQWPIDDISLADFSTGKLLYLSDIEPASTKWTSLVGPPAAASVAAEYGQPRRDKSAYGGPLALTVSKDDTNRDGEASAEPGSTGQLTRTFNKGLALRSRTEIVYRLPAGYQRFITLAGIDPSTSAAGNVRLVISGDERVLLETEIEGNKPPQSIQLDIAGVKRLKFLVDYGQNLDTGDWLNLCEARIAK
jgi:hypothetical protein